MKKIVLPALIALVFVLAACAPGTPQAGSNGLETAVAATVDAALAATRAAQPQPAEPLPLAPVSTTAPEASPTAEPIAEAPADATADLKVAYTDGQGDLWFWQTGSDPVKIVGSSDVVDFALSPDGSRIFFARAAADMTESLWLVGADGSNELPVMSAAGFDAMPRPTGAMGTAPAQLSWVPGSATAVFTTYYRFDGPGIDMGEDLYLVDGATGAVSTLFTPGQGGGMFFYSPDGNQIALVNPNRIDLIRSDGSNRRNAVLSYGDILMYTESPFYAQPVWSADSSKLRVILLAPDRMGKPDEPSSVWEIPAAGGEAVKLLDFHLNGLGPGAAISPDLQRLAYFQNVGSGGKQDLHIAGLDGGADEVYASGSLNWVTWTDDSQGFAWTDYSQVGSERKTFLGRLGQQAIQLGSPQTPYDLSWVAGDCFLFLTNDGGTPPAWSLYLGTVGGSNQLVATLPAGNGFPRFEFVK